MIDRFQPIRTLRGGIVYDRVEHATHDQTTSYEQAEELAAELNELTNGIHSYQEQDWVLYVRENEEARREEAFSYPNLSGGDSDELSAEEAFELSIQGRRVA